MHIGWVPDGSPGYQARWQSWSNPNGLFGRAYLAAIKPFRRLIVYPVLVRRIEREWLARTQVDPRLRKA